MRRVLAIPLALALALGLAVAGCDRAAEDRPAGPADFAFVAPVTAASGGPVQRIDLPAAALVALRRADRGDIRVFDAGGRPLSTALVDARAVRLAPRRFPAIAVASGPGALPGAGISVRVDRDGDAVTVNAERGQDAGGADRAVLLDTRTLADPAQAIVLDADLPVQRPVAFRIEASGDLTKWEPLAEQVLFRPGPAADLLGTGRIALPGAALKDRYLRVRWSGEAGARVSGATLLTSQVQVSPRVSVAATGLALGDSHHLDFTLPAGLPPAALRVRMTGRDGIVPVRLFARETSEAPWTLLAVASLRQEANGSLLETGGTTAREWRIEADERSAGFSKAPDIALLYEPVAVLAAFNGVAPYRLAAGNATAAPAFLAPSQFASGAPYPRAAVARTSGAVRVAVEGARATGIASYRSLALWAVLILGALVLAFATFRLFRANAGTDAGDAGRG